MKKQKEDIVTPVPGTPGVVIVPIEPVDEVKTFDAGFFSVASPVRSPSFHCEGIDLQYYDMSINSLIHIL